MDGAHTHGHGPGGLGELVVLAFGVVVAADVLARVLTLLLIVLAVAGGVLVIGFIGYVVAAGRRYQQATALEAAQHHWPVVPEDPPRAVNADPGAAATGDHRTASPAPDRPRRSAHS